MTQSPPDEGTFSIVCQKELADTFLSQSGTMFVSFISTNGKTILLAAITKSELKDPAATIKVREAPKRLVEWAYVFDRNGDGKVDYIVWPVGIVPFKPRDFPADFPKGSTLTFQQLEYLQKNARLLLQHWADDSFEGKISAVVIEASDPERAYLVDGWQTIQSTHFDGILDDCWYFNESIGQKSGDCERSGQGYKTRSLIFKPMFGPDNLAGMSKVLSIFNEAAGQCNLRGDSF